MTRTKQTARRNKKPRRKQLATKAAFKDDLEGYRAMSSILKTQFGNINLMLEATFMEGYRAGFDKLKRILKENHPEIDVSNFEVHDFPMPPEALKHLPSANQVSCDSPAISPQP
ncbi:uncharacterized protein LOC132166392 [Corylus avellana]|uniref:uncharacterized protein LOC132166392 n=1 Tax=Corylus avellana TaxID=13451 RepID=UPI001E1F83AF|nr:uncharacterized protein LOC132166392 [Corylus avellana]